LRRRLCSAERFSERAMLRGSRREKTPWSNVSASLVSVTRCDQRLPGVGLRAVFLPVALLRVAMRKTTARSSNRSTARGTMRA
jgi:hypothetical protein